MRSYRKESTTSTEQRFYEEGRCDSKLCRRHCNYQWRVKQGVIECEVIEKEPTTSTKQRFYEEGRFDNKLCRRHCNYQWRVKQGVIECEVIEKNLPLLLSKDSMKKAGVALNFVEDNATINVEKIDLGTTSSGHYIIPLR